MGFIGLFVGAVILSLGFKLFQAWLETDSNHSAMTLAGRNCVSPGPGIYILKTSDPFPVDGGFDVDVDGDVAEPLPVLTLSCDGPCGIFSRRSTALA